MFSGGLLRTSNSTPQSSSHPQETSSLFGGFPTGSSAGLSSLQAGLSQPFSSGTQQPAGITPSLSPFQSPSLLQPSPGFHTISNQQQPGGTQQPSSLFLGSVQPTSTQVGLASAVPQSSLYSAPSTGFFSQSGDSTLKRPASLFGTSATPLLGSSSVSPSFLTTGGPGSSLLFGDIYKSQQQNQTLSNVPLFSNITAAATPIFPEVQKVLETLNNADVRSCQVLTDTFKRLKTLSTEPPLLISFTYEIDSNPQSIIQKRAILEQQVNILNNATVSNAYNNAKSNNPDSSKYAIVPIQGFEGIITRAKLQSQNLEQLERILQELKSRQDVIQNHLEVHSLKRFNDVVHRHRQLAAGVMRAVGQFEEYALINSLAQVDVIFLQKLQDDLETLTDDFQNSSAGRLSLSQASFDIQLLMDDIFSDNYKESGDPAPLNETIPQEFPLSNGEDLSDRDVKNVRKIIQNQKALFESLETEIRFENIKSKRLFELLESGNTFDDNNNSK